VHPRQKGTRNQSSGEPDGGTCGFSRRLNLPREKNRQTRLREELSRRGVPMLDLTVSNPTRSRLDYPDELFSGITETRSWARYRPHPRGLLQAREAVAGYYLRRGIQAKSDDIVITACTSEAYSFLFKILADPGEKVLIPRPGYPLFEYLARFESLRAIPYPLYYSGDWQIDLEAVEEAVDPQTRAVLVVDPNNPTGHYATRAEWAKLVEIGTERGPALISDEVFWDYLIETRDCAPVRPDDPPCLCFRLNGLSKLVGLPQVKLSWILVQGPAKLKSEALERLEWVADTFLSVHSAVQEALPSILRPPQIIQDRILARIRHNARALQRTVAGTLVEPLPVEGGWSAVLKLPALMSDEEWALRILEEEKTIVHPGCFFGFPPGAFIVLGLLTPTNDFRRGVGRVLRLVSRVAEGDCTDQPAAGASD